MKKKIWDFIDKLLIKFLVFTAKRAIQMRDYGLAASCILHYNQLLNKGKENNEIKVIRLP
jgi:hypothetical protein